MQLAGDSSFCLSQNVTYGHRVYDPDNLNWCPVPGGGADALLFAGLAVFCSCALYSKLSAVWVMMAGALFQVANFYFNLNHFSNALTIWLGMHPSTIFFQIFLPPLLLDSAVRLDFFLFKKMAAHCLMFASFNVLVSTAAFIPLMLYGLNLAAAGWRPVDAALFGAMLGSTDAVAVTAILKAGGAPEMLSTLLECESLFNDASSIVLFEIFLHRGMAAAADVSGSNVSGFAAIWSILKLIGWLSITGAAAGLLMGLTTRLLFKLLHRRHVPPSVEVAVSLAGAYTVYLCTEYYVHGSGVIGVVVYGLYGASSYQWGFSSKGTRQQAFFRFWDVASFCINGMVFFFVGASVTNFLVSITAELFEGGKAEAALLTVKCLPAIITAMFALRWLLMTVEAPLLSLVGPRLTWQEVAFSALGGLRGGLALILAQTVLASHGATKDPQLKVVHAEMVIWVAAVVLFTLTVNASLLGPVMTALGLNKTTPAQRHMHRRAYAALLQFTRRTIAELQSDDDEILRGVDWSAVACTADMCNAVKKVLRSSNTLTARRDNDVCRQSPELHGSIVTLHKRNKSKAAAGVSASLVSDVLSSSDDAYAFSSARGSMDEKQGFRGSFNRQNPGSPMFLTRANLATASSRSFGGLTVPLLGRQYSSRAAARYSAAAAAAGDDASQGSTGGADDLESGRQQQQQLFVPRVVAESSSEAVFIASRLQEQDQQLAKHAEEAEDGPILANAHIAAAAAGDTDSSAAAATAAGGGSEDHEEEVQSAADENSEWGSSSSSGAADAEVPVGNQEAAAAAGGAGVKKAKFRALQPLIALRMTDVMRFSNQYDMTGAYGHVHSAALNTSALPANPAAAAGGGSQLYSSSSSGGLPLLAGFNQVAGPGGVLRSNSVQILSSVYRPQLAHQGGRNEALGGALAAAQRAWSSSFSTAAATGTALTLQQQQQQQQQQLLSRSQAAGQGMVLPTDPGGARCILGGDFGEAMSVITDDEDELTQEEFLEECRVSLLAGLKRHFRFKAAEGLLSKTSLRLLDYACDACLSQPGKPLDLWRTIGSDIKRGGATSFMAALHLQLRRYQTKLLRLTTGGGGFLVRWLLHGPVQRASKALRDRLGIAALTVLEVALELWLALTASPQARMVRQGTSMASGMLQEELRSQADTVWRFIMDRQVEAPDEFASLQTHRVQLAVARRQLAFVEQLSEVGAVEEVAAEALLEMVERRLHRLERLGPSWQPPSLTDVLRRQPFLADQSEGMLLWLRAYGELKSYAPGQCIVPRRRTGPPGVFIVLSGLVKVELLRAKQQTSYFVGVGGSVGYLSSLLGRDYPGVTLLAAFAQGNALGRGPLVLHLPMRLLATIKQRAAAALPPAAAAAATQLEGYGPAYFSGTGGSTVGSVEPSSMNAAAFAQLLLDMHRQAGVMLLDRMGDGVVQHTAAHVELAVKAIFDYASHLPPSKAHARLQRLLEALMGSSSSSALAAAGFADASSADISAAADSFILPAELDARTSSSLGIAAAAGGNELQAAVAEAAMQLVLDRGAAAAAMLRGLLHTADLITVAAGHQVWQSSTMVLLNGCLRLHNSSRFSSALQDTSTGATAAGAAGVGAGAAAGATAGAGAAAAPFSIAMRQFNAPTLLAWAPELFDQLEDRYDQQAAVYTAGPRGALLLVTPSEGGSSSSSEAGDTPAAPEEKQQQQPTEGAAAAAAVWRRQGEQRQQPERLSSVRPLHQIAASVVGPDQDAVC